MSAFKPTDEQTAIVDGFRTGDDLVIEAGAGAGKTSTLKLCAKADLDRRGVYIAYNKAISTDAAKSFPASVLCKTAHALAYGAVGRQFSARLRAPRQPARETCRILGINDPLRLAQDLAPLAPQQLARIVTATIQRFCYSADERIERRHVPLLAGIDMEPERAELARYIVPLAQRAWDTDITQVNGKLRFTHDAYLKLWCLSKPQLAADYVLLDEAQDSNPAVSGLVNAQRNAQRIAVGDACQAIYGWRGATNAMQTWPGKRLYLSQSFRFGQLIADEANKWLSVLDAPLRLRGFDAVPSTIGALAVPDAVLCRCNAEAVRQVAAMTGAGHRTALVGGGRDIEALAEAAIDLRAGRGTAHPELMAFTTWAEVQDYADHDSAGSDLKVAVDLIDSYGPEGVIDILRRLVHEDRAEVVISTAHKAKGREWNRVRIADDFREPRDDPETGRPGVIQREDAMLAYVAVTRAKRVLDRSGLAWVDRWVTGLPTPAPSMSAPRRERARTVEDMLEEAGLGMDAIKPQPALEPADDALFAAPDPDAPVVIGGVTFDRGPGDTLVSPTCLRPRCGLPREECRCATAPLTWEAMTGLTRQQFLARAGVKAGA